MTAITCELCHLTYADNVGSDAMMHKSRHKRFEQAIESLGFKLFSIAFISRKRHKPLCRFPMNYKNREALKRKGYLSMLSGNANAFEVMNGMNMVIKARYDRDISRAINADQLETFPSYYEFFFKEAESIRQQLKL